MADHVTQWLGTYLDGELRGANLRQVESHLAECDQCQAELDGMLGLSTLLRETSPNGEFISTERFIANLTLNLPRQTEQPQTRKVLEIGWWLIPVAVLGAWAFLQVTSSLSSLVLTLSDAGLLGSNLSWLQGNPPQTEWFATAMDLFGSQIGFTGRATLSVLNDTSLFIHNLTGAYIWQAILATLYLGWLASWWFFQHKQSPSAGTFSQS